MSDNPVTIATSAFTTVEGNEAADSDRFLVFLVGKELYGCTLTQVREVLKITQIKSVPFMVPHFRGVVNLRGQVIGIMDLALKLGVRREALAQGLILVTETRTGPLGVVVDEILSVERFSGDQIERHSAVETKIAPSFIEGIAKWGDRLVHLVHLAEMIGNEEFRLNAA